MAREPKTKRTYLGGNAIAAKLRERKLLNAAMEGRDVVEEGIKLGYSPKTVQKTVSNILRKPSVQADFQKMLDQIIPDERLILKYSDLLDATNRDREGNPVGDNTTQLKCADSIAKLKGRMVSEQPPQDIKILIANYSEGDTDVSVGV